MKLHDILVQLWTEEGLSYVASSGLPLYADAVTEAMNRISYARICSEVEDKEVYANRINVILEDRAITPVLIEYQAKPPSCPNCLMFGHTLSRCTKSKVVKTTQTNSCEATMTKTPVTAEWTLVSKKSTTKSPAAFETGESSGIKECNVGKESCDDHAAKPSLQVFTDPVPLSNSFEAMDLENECEATPEPTALAKKVMMVDELANKQKTNGITDVKSGGKNRRWGKSNKT